MRKYILIFPDRLSLRAKMLAKNGIKIYKLRMFIKGVIN